MIVGSCLCRAFHILAGDSTSGEEYGHTQAKNNSTTGTSGVVTVNGFAYF